MTRFDVLGPHKAALKSIHASGAADFALAGPYLSSQHWMLQAAGIGTDGATGALRVAGLGLAYASVFRVWLEDDDPGLAKTMAALDRRLRRGERTLGGIEQLHTAVSRFGEALQELARNATRGRPKPSPSPGPEAGQVVGWLDLHLRPLPVFFTWGEGRGEGQRPALEQASAPHPNPLPTEEWGEGTACGAHRGRVRPSGRVWRHRSTPPRPSRSPWR